jgi:hypothetical protein
MNANICKTCGEEMSDKRFNEGKMCCDKPLFHEDEDEDEDEGVALVKQLIAALKRDPALVKEFREVLGPVLAKIDEESVDDYEAPNIYPYKKCGGCSQRSSCGSYDSDKLWLCEGCGE